MKTSKLFGICIVFLIVAVSANAITLNDLLDSYNNYYSDGGFNVVYSGYSGVPAYNISYQTVAGKEAGRYNLYFIVNGPDTSSQYTISSNTKVSSSNYYAEQTKTGNGTATISLDGNYFFCGLVDIPKDYTFATDIRIYQDGFLKYQNQFSSKVSCSVYRISFGTQITGNMYDPINITAKDTNADGKLDIVNVTLKLQFPENRAYKIGYYIWDNKTGTAYSEKTITPGGLYKKRNVSVIFTSNQLKDFNLNREKIYLKSIFADDHLLETYTSYFSQVHRYNLGKELTSLTASKRSPKFSTSNFSFSTVYVQNYTFIPVYSGEKIKQLGINLQSTNSAGPYDVELSLENIYGEVVETKQGIINSPSTTFYFNGTNIYQSKVNGPYRIGFIRIMQSNNEIFYKTNTATSTNLAYTNFTSPDMADLEAKEIQSDGTDVNITINNLGKGDAVGATVTLFDDNANKIKEIIIDSISNSETYTYQFMNANIGSGFVFIDLNNMIEETNETNNVIELIPIGPNNIPEILNSPKKTATRGIQYVYKMLVNDLDNDTLTYITSDPARFSINQATGNYTWTPDENEFGVKEFTFSVNDGRNTTSKKTNISIFSNSYEFRAGTLDYDSETFINSTIDVNSQIKNTTESGTIKFNVSADTKITMSNSASGHRTDADYIYLDSGLTSCVAGQNCAFSGTYTTNCQWQINSSVTIMPLTNSWYCSVEGGDLPEKDWFRYIQSPENYARKFNYLVKT